jgi:hypothetical protein
MKNLRRGEGYLGVDRRIVSKWVLVKNGFRVWNGFNGLRTGSFGDRL